MPRHHWHCRGRVIDFAARPLVMAILNVTPDSFSDGGRHADPLAAGLALVEAGADILDIGGESTRPNATPVSLADELARVVPAVRELAKRTTVPISVDTTKAEVARQCLDAGAEIVNDVSGLTADAAMPGVLHAAAAGVVVMHMFGTPRTMQDDPRYDDVVREVGDYFGRRLRELADAGIAPERVCLDPGIGFGKRTVHNLDLLANLAAFRRHGRPVCLGVSRKGFLGTVCGRELADRMPGTLATNVFAAATGDADILRVHDVGPARDAVLLLQKFREHRRHD